VGYLACNKEKAVRDTNRFVSENEAMGWKTDREWVEGIPIRTDGLRADASVFDLEGVSPRESFYNYPMSSWFFSHTVQYTSISIEDVGNETVNGPLASELLASVQMGRWQGKNPG
jgi:hypothetical protein